MDLYLILVLSGNLLSGETMPVLDHCLALLLTLFLGFMAPHLAYSQIKSQSHKYPIGQPSPSPCLGLFVAKISYEGLNDGALKIIWNRVQTNCNAQAAGCAAYGPHGNDPKKYSESEKPWLEAYRACVTHEFKIFRDALSASRRGDDERQPHPDSSEGR